MEIFTLLGGHSKLQAGEKYTDRNFNSITRLPIAKTEIFEKVVNFDAYFLVIYFNGEVMRITHAKFQAKILNIMGSRALGR